MIDTVAILRQAFPTATDTEIAALRRGAEIRAYPPNCVLCHEGEVEHVFYIVADGEVAVTHERGGAEVRRVLAIRKPGEFFGEMALIDDKPRAASVTTLSETTVLEISEEVFKDFLRHSPMLALTLIRSITDNIRSTNQAAIADLTQKNVELAQAYLELKTAQAELVQKERLERELEIAGEVQRSLLPEKFPAVSGYSFAGRNVPARHVGGDLYDVIPVDNNHVGLLMADVSDKGVHAALIMAVTRTLFLSHARRSLSPVEVCMAVHDGLLEVSTKDDMFVTAFYGVLRLDNGRLRYIRAGQDRPLLFHAENKPPELLDAEGRFLGMLPNLKLQERATWLSPGDLLVSYSDGVTDAINEADEAYGVDRLVALLSRRRAASAEEVCAAIFDDVFAFRGAAAAFDDITVLVTRFQGRP